MEMKNIDPNEENLGNNNEQEDQPNNNLNNLADVEASRKKLLPFSMKIKKFKNKYYQRSVYSIIFIVGFLFVTLLNFYGWEIFFNYVQKFGTQDNTRFEIRPGTSNPIQINHNNWKPLFDDMKDYLSPKSSEYCKSDANYFCLLTNETKNSQCSEGQTYGLKYGDPCILIDLKPVSKWLTSNKTLNSRIHLKCDGEKSVDKELVGPIEYFPRNGVPVEYFTSNETESSSPAIFVHLLRPAMGVMFFVECHVFSESRDEMNVFDEQSIKFEIIVDM